jgi:hypothetical protein
MLEPYPLYPTFQHVIAVLYVLDKHVRVYIFTLFEEIQNSFMLQIYYTSHHYPVESSTLLISLLVQHPPPSARLHCLS